MIRGDLEHEANHNDVVLLKSSEQSPRLPTYHFAHAVDDHLMRVDLVIRAEEWISSVPLHLQLFEAIGSEPPQYAHIAPLMKQIPGGKRKLSKRKDAEAGVDFYVEQGYPADAVLYYLRGLANGRLAEMPLEQALAEPIHLDECGVAGPLVDLVKLEDISGDHIATLSSEQVVAAVRAWAERFDPVVAKALDTHPDLAVRAVSVERVGVENPRKDLRKWSDFRGAYGFFFPQLFEPVTAPTDERFAGLGVAPDVVRRFLAEFADGYQPLEDGDAWFGQIRELAARQGFAPSPKEFKKNPDAYPGSIREASQIVRIALTGSTRSPNLPDVARTLGADEVLRRLARGRLTCSVRVDCAAATSPSCAAWSRPPRTTRSRQLPGSSSARCRVCEAAPSGAEDAYEQAIARVTAEVHGLLDALPARRRPPATVPPLRRPEVRAAHRRPREAAAGVAPATCLG